MTGRRFWAAAYLEAATLGLSGVASSIGAATLDPNNLVFNGGALRYLGSSVTTDHALTLNTNGTLEIATDTTTVTVSGIIGGTGGLIKYGPGTLIVNNANTYTGATTLSNGVSQINTTASALPSGAINFNGGTISLNVSGQDSYPNAINVANAGGIVSAGGNNNLVTGPWSGAGTMSISIASGGTFTVNGNMTTNFVGAITLGNSAGTFRFNGGGSSSGAQQSTGSPTVTFDLGTNTATLLNRNGGGTSYGTYYLGGLACGPGTAVRGSANAGSPNTYQIGDNNFSTTFSGIIANGGGGSAAVVSIYKTGTGTLTLGGASTYTGATVVTNGVLAFVDGGSLASPTIIVVSNATLDVSARTDGSFTLNSGQTFTGNGTVLGSVIATSGAIISPADTINNVQISGLVITNALVLQTGCTIFMDIDEADKTNDMITGLASVTYAGTLDVSQFGSSYVVGDSFKLFSATSYNGAFDAINPATPGTGMIWDTNSLAVDGTLKVAVQPPPLPTGIASFQFSGADLTLTVSNGTAGVGFSVLTSTNVALPLNQWTPINTGTFDGSQNFQVLVPGAATAGSPSQYYSLQVGP